MLQHYLAPEQREPDALNMGRSLHLVINVSGCLLIARRQKPSGSTNWIAIRQPPPRTSLRSLTLSVGFGDVGTWDNRYDFEIQQPLASRGVRGSENLRFVIRPVTMDDYNAFIHHFKTKGKPTARDRQQLTALVRYLRYMPQYARLVLPAVAVDLSGTPGQQHRQIEDEQPLAFAIPPLGVNLLPDLAHVEMDYIKPNIGKAMSGGGNYGEEKKRK